MEPPQQELSTTPSQFVSGSLASANAAATFGPGLGQLFITNRSSWLDTRVYPHHLLAPSSVPSDKKTVRRRISESGEDEQYEQEDDDSDGKDDTDPYGVPSVIPVAIVLEAILPGTKTFLKGVSAVLLLLILLTLLQITNLDQSIKKTRA